MKISEKFQKGKIEIGEIGYLNKNCWLIKNLNYVPYKRCQYCEIRFRNCLFLQYQIISLLLIIFSFSLFLLIEKKISALVIITVFVLIIVYGYFFNKSTEKIIRANFSEKKSKDALKELTDKLEEKVDEQTQDIQKKADHLERLLKMRSEFLDIVSHQLRTPMSVILGMASMFREGSVEKLSKEKQREFIDSIFFKAKKLGSIINDILRASEMDTEEFRIESSELKPTQVEEVIKSVYEDLVGEAQKRHLQFIFNKPKKLTMRVLAHADYLEQAIYNLVDNAIKYTKEGFVKINLTEEDGRMIIKIEDSGIGIPEKDQPKMFDKFARAGNAVNCYTDGSGLGLFIVKKIITAHPGGEVSFTSEENKGAAFTISLPII